MNRIPSKISWFRVLLIAPLIGPAPGCMAEGQWSFPLSRSFYEQSHDMILWGDDQEDPFMTVGATGAAAAVLVLPFLMDLVILPVTGPRDLWVFREAWMP